MDTCLKHEKAEKAMHALRRVLHDARLDELEAAEDALFGPGGSGDVEVDGSNVWLRSRRMGGRDVVLVDDPDSGECCVAGPGAVRDAMGRARRRKEADLLREELYCLDWDTAREVLKFAEGLRGCGHGAERRFEDEDGFCVCTLEVRRAEGGRAPVLVFDTPDMARSLAVPRDDFVAAAKEVLEGAE
jgi:hypothetical protein